MATIINPEVSSRSVGGNSASHVGRLPELDGLRGIAILMVVSLHYIPNARTTDNGFGLLYHFAQVFRLGWSGVDLFLVLSGFLIGGILLDARHASNYFSTFYLRRVHRILPVYFAWLALFPAWALFLSWKLNYHVPSSAVASMLLVHVLFLQNFISTLTTYPALLWIAATWSLAVEEQFYLVAPLMVRYLSPKRLTYMLIGCIVAAPILRAILYNFSPAGKELYYVMMPCRADALAAGMFAALAWRSDTKFWLERHTVLLRQTLGVLVLGAVVMLKWLPGHIAHSTWQAAFQYSWMAALYVCLIMLALLEQNGVIARVARWKFLREWGRVSYCVYLVHLGVLGLCHLALRGGEPSLTSWSGFFTTLLALALTWGLAQSSWKFFEKPLLNRGHHYQYLRADPSIA